MARIGVIKEIWRFPVKSMQGDSIDRCVVTDNGVVGDHRWPMRDEGRAEVQWGKMYPQLMLCSARYRNEPQGDDIGTVDVTFPDGETVGSDDARVHHKLTELIGREAKLWPLQPASNVQFYKRYKPDERQFMQEITDAFAREPGEPGEPVPEMSQFPEVLLDHVSVPGTFFDNEEIHLIATASIAYMRTKTPDANWDIRRFRPNFFIQTDPGLDGLVENEWVGQALDRRRRDPADFRADNALRDDHPSAGRSGIRQDHPRTVVKEGEQCLGVGAHVRVNGEIRQGDAVDLID